MIMMMMEPLGGVSGDSEELFSFMSQHRKNSVRGKVIDMCVCQVLHLCLALCDPVDCSPPGSSVHGILQARLLEWVAKPFSRGSSRPRDRTHISCLLHWQAGSLPLAPPGKPKVMDKK